MHKRQRGFSIIELLIVLIILILLGTFGWLIYNNQHKSKATATSGTSSQTKTTNSKVVEYTSWTQIPSDLQKAILTAWGPLPSPVTPEDPCPTTVQSTVTTESPVTAESDTYAITGVGCDGGAANLFAKVNGSWRDIEQTQDLFSCDIIQQYSVPLQLIVDGSPPNNGLVTCSQNNGTTFTYPD